MMYFLTTFLINLVLGCIANYRKLKLSDPKIYMYTVYYKTLLCISI